EQIQLAKDKILEGIRRKNDEQWNIGRRAFRDTIYGRTHFYAWNPTPESVNRLTRADLVALHNRVLAPNQAILSVSGDFKTDELMKKLEAVLGTWKGAPREVPVYDYTIHSASTASAVFVDKDLAQSLIYIGGVGISRHDPNLYALSVANSILG